MHSAIKVFSKLAVCIRQFQYDEVQFKKSLNSIFLYILYSLDDLKYLVIINALL
jgi:hypothetical protein